MRSENIEVTFKIPIPVDKPDLNGVLYSKEAIRNAYKNVKDIQVAGENGFRIRPCLSKGKFLVMYECMMKAYKVIIPSNAFPYSMNENGDFEICIPSEENK